MGRHHTARARRPVASLTSRPAGLFFAVLCVLASLFCLAVLKLGGASAPLALIQPALPRLSHDGWRILDPSPPLVFEEEDATPAPRQPQKRQQAKAGTGTGAGPKAEGELAEGRRTPGAPGQTGQPVQPGPSAQPGQLGQPGQPGQPGQTAQQAAPQHPGQLADQLPLAGQTYSSLPTAEGQGQGQAEVSGRIRQDAQPRPPEVAEPSEGELLLRETPDTAPGPRPKPGPREEPTPAPQAPTGHERGVLAIVVDDMGASLTAARRLLDLPFPVTFSILPDLAASTQTARLAEASGRPPMLHQPMEPGAWPRINPGPGGIYLITPDEDIPTILEKNLRQIPGVVGVNNHMGSRLTRSSTKMSQVMAALRGRGLFFLDSLTAPDSAAGREAWRAGIVTYKRDVFLDHRIEPSAIMAKLREAEHLALAHGQAVAIGHPHLETIEALERFAKNRDRRVEIRLIGSLTPQRP